MFYLLILPTLALSVMMICNFLSMRKHDKVLYVFCQIRRDIILLVDQRGLEFERVGYHSVRNLLNSINIMIHNYEGCKVQLFNIRRLMALLKNYKHITRQAEKIVIPDDAEIIVLHKRFRRAMVCAFFAYTPFIRSEITAWVFFKLFTFLAKTGAKSMKTAADNLCWLVEEVKNSHNHKNGPLPA
jgi:hypothetical protein